MPAGAEDWYFRPRDGGPYCAAPCSGGDGQTYQSAWHLDDTGDDGGSVDWSRVQPGDTLFVCGFHDSGFRDRQLRVAASGTEAQPITISGDCRNGTEPDPGEILAAGLRLGGTDWRGADIYGNYFRDNVGAGALHQNFERRIAEGRDSITRLRKVAHCPPVAALDAGSFCYDASTATLYYGPPGPSAADFVVYTGGAIPLEIEGRSHVVVRDITLRNSATDLVRLINADSISLANLRLQWAASNAVGVYSDSDDGELRDSMVSDVGNGLYLIANSNATNNDRWQVRGNTIYNIDADGYLCNGDAHALAFQGGSGHVIEHNEIHSGAGSAIGFYTSAGQQQKDAVVRFNRVHDIRDQRDFALCDRAPGSGRLERGIDYHRQNRNHNPDDVTGNVAHHNVLWNIAAEGIRTRSFRPTYGAPWSFFNNVVYNARIAFAWNEYADDTEVPGIAFVARNNIFMNSTSWHIDQQNPNDRDDHTGIVMTNNLFHPDAAGRYRWAGVAHDTLSAWQAVSGKGQDSLVADPALTDMATGDAHLAPASSAIDSGVDVGNNPDIDGEPVVAQADIGADEFTPLTLRQGDSALADLQVTIEAQSALVLAGDEVAYAISIRNAGAYTAATVRIEGRVPDGAALADVSTAAGDCVAGESYSCALGDMPPGAAAEVSLRLRFTEPGNFVTAVQAAGNGADARPEDNVTSATTSVLGSCAGTGSWKIAGKIFTTLGSAVPDTLVTVVGDLSDRQCGTRVLSNKRGQYALPGLASATYLLTPARTGCSAFTPPSRRVTVSGANRTGQNFTASCP